MMPFEVVGSRSLSSPFAHLLAFFNRDGAANPSTATHIKMRLVCRSITEEDELRSLSSTPAFTYYGDHQNRNTTQSVDVSTNKAACHLTREQVLMAEW